MSTITAQSSGRTAFRLLSLLVLLLAQAAADATTVLYDPDAVTLPGPQGWLSIIDASSTHSLTAGVVELDTTADFADQSGYFTEDPFTGTLFQHPALPVLDRAQGFTLSFELAVLEELHQSPRDDNGDGLDDRAGFSVIAISQDLFGLELGFFDDRVFAYAAAGEGAGSLFTQAESALIDTALFTRYELRVFDLTYALFAESTRVLSGSLRNYNPSGVSVLANPYDNPNLVFLGDDTTSAASRTRIGEVAIANGRPELESAAPPLAVPADRPASRLALALVVVTIALARSRRLRPAAAQQSAPSGVRFNLWGQRRRGLAPRHGQVAGRACRPLRGRLR